jgi:hypothetical protein
MLSAQSGNRAEVAADPADDWLSDASELDWFEEPGGAAGPRPPAPGRGPSPGAPVYEDEPPVDDVIRRRRLIAFIAVLAVILVGGLLWLVVFSGGSTAPPTPTTTPVDTTPVVTTPTTPVTTTTTQTTTTTGTTTTPATGGTAAVTLPAAGKIKPGDTGDDVKAVQTAINEIGAAVLTVDGNYGTLTQQAVSAFQQENGLTVDGIVGPQTAAALNSALAAKG